MSYNKIVLIGRITKDAELSFLPGSGTPKQTFTVACDRAYQKDKNNKVTDFIPCEQIGKHVEKLSQYMNKGKLILVEGELNIDQYEKDGQRRSFTKIKVDKVCFLGGGQQEVPKPNFDPILDADDEIPF